MRVAVLCALFVVALTLPAITANSPAAKPEDVGLSSERLQRITKMIERRIAAGQLAGAVTIVGRRGKVAHHVAQGVMDRDSKQPMATGSMFRIASMTKPVIGVAVMMLVEEGKLHLNDPVARYIPEFRDMKVAVPLPAGGPAPAPTGGAAAPRFYTVPAQRPITIKDLLTHTSGLGSGPMSTSDIEKVARKDGETLADYIPRLGGTALEFQPGSRWAYSPGAGFETLGRVIEIASGEQLDRFFRTRIFDPLGMKDITFWPTDAQWPRVATVYGRGPNGLTKAVMPNDTMSRNVYFRGSGGLYSTAEDYIPLGLMLANGGELNGKRLLEPQDGGDDVGRARARHAAGAAARAGVRAQRARGHQPRRAQHHAVRRHLRLDRRPGHALLRRPEGRPGRRPDGADLGRRGAARVRGPGRPVGGGLSAH